MARGGCGEHGGGGQCWRGGLGTAWELREETAVWDVWGDCTLRCVGTGPAEGLHVPGAAKVPVSGWGPKIWCS